MLYVLFQSFGFIIFLLYSPVGCTTARLSAAGKDWCRSPEMFLLHCFSLIFLFSGGRFLSLWLLSHFISASFTTQWGSGGWPPPPPAPQQQQGLFYGAMHQQVVVAWWWFKGDPSHNTYLREFNKTQQIR